MYRGSRKCSAGFAGCGAFRQAEPSVLALGGGGGAEPGGDCHLLGLQWQLQGCNGNCRAGMAPGGRDARGKAPGAPSPGRLCPRPAALAAEAARLLRPAALRATRASACWSGNDFSTNCSSKQTLNRCLQVGRENQAVQLLFLSSSLVFAGRKTPWNEISCLHLLSPSLGRGENRDKATAITSVAPFAISFTSKTKETGS